MKGKKFFRSKQNLFIVKLFAGRFYRKTVSVFATITKATVFCRRKSRIKKLIRTILSFFYRHKQSALAGLLILFLIILGIKELKRQVIRAASYTWTQTAWTGGATTNNANHPDDQSGWSEYSSKDANVSAGDSVTLVESALSKTETNDSDFGIGATIQTQINGTGDTASVELSTYFSPIITGSQDGYSFGRDQDVKVSGDYAYVVNDVQDFRVLDISDPANPSVVGTYNTPTGGMGVDLQGNYAFVANSEYNLEILDVSDPQNITEVGTYSTSSIINGIDVEGNYAYLTCGSNGLYIIDISNPSNPTLVGIANESTDVFYKVKVVGSYAYVTDGLAGLRIIDVSDPANPVLIGTYNTPYVARGVDISGSYAYVADEQSGLQIIDISDPANPVLAASYETNWAYDVSIYGSYAYVGDGRTAGEFKLLVFDISDSQNPNLKGSCDSLSDDVLSVYALDNKVYLANDDAGLFIVQPNIYYSSGSFVSGVITISNTQFASINWTAILPSGTSLEIKARSATDANMSDASDWSSCSALTNGQDLSDSDCVTDGNDYVQYQVTFASTSPIYTPSFNAIEFNYLAYTQGTLISSPYNSSDAANILASLAWTETVPANTEIKFQIRTAPDNAGSPGTWSDWLGPSSSTDYYVDPNGGETINSLHTDSANDQWVQYKVYLESTNGKNTPALLSTSLTYVVNAPPEIRKGILLLLLNTGTALAGLLAPL